MRICYRLLQSGPPNCEMITLAICGFVCVIFTGYCNRFS
nr:MAG TPA: hypothetical protein [Caudoviricetes sp.]